MEVCYLLISFLFIYSISANKGFWIQALLNLFGFFALINLELPASLNTVRRRLREENLQTPAVGDQAR